MSEISSSDALAEMLKNFWYAVEHSNAVKPNKPIAARLMDDEFVLYRGEHEQLFALDRRCSHRYAALEQGQIEGNCIRCPYHGWLYESDGHCSEIPSNQPGMKISGRARVKSYPVQEKYGLVWIFWGDGSPSESPPIPRLLQLEQPGWRKVPISYSWDAYYTAVVANLIDTVHINFLHRNSFSSRKSVRKNYEIEEGENSVCITATTLSKTKPPFALRWLMGKNPPSGMFKGIFYLPNIVYLELNFSHMRLPIFASSIPVSNTQTITKLLIARNFVTTPLVDTIVSNTFVKILNEDFEVVSSLPKAPWPDDMAQEVHVHSDAMELAMRKLFKQAMQNTLND